MAEAIVIGVVTRTGSAVAIALGGSVDTPRFWARLEFGLTAPGRPAQPYHAAAGMELSAASHLIGHVERDAEEAAAGGLRAVADLLPAGAVRGVAVVVKDVSVPDRLPDVLRSHAWMHAAEGILYRKAALAAAQACGWTAHAVELASLPAAEPALAAVGRAAGRPWRRAEKDAARAAIAVLAGTVGPRLTRPCAQPAVVLGCWWLCRDGWRYRMDRPGGLSAIGNTPVVRLPRMAGMGDAEVWVKMEAANPTGSYKDRMALAMIEAAEADGRLRPGQLVVEYTGGSTGSSLAFVCAVKGYPLRIVSSDAFSEEKIRTMRAFGAEVELIPSPEGITPDLIPSMMRRAAEITAQTGGFATDQFNNTDMVEGYRRLGEELLDQLPGPPPVSAFCSYVGTAGCFLGASRALAAKAPGLHRVVVEPGESAVLSGGPPGTHHIEGGGIGRRPPMLHPADYDEVIAIPEAEAFETARRAARDEGIFSGPSTGANLAAALTLARRLGPGRRVVTLQVDSGLKYLAGQLYS